MLLLISKADVWLKQNMSYWSANSFDFPLEELHSHWRARAFFPRKTERINRPIRHVLLHDLRLNKRLGKQWGAWWFETPSRPLWRHCSGLIFITFFLHQTVVLTTYLAPLPNSDNHTCKYHLQNFTKCYLLITEQKNWLLLNKSLQETLTLKR